MLHTVHWNGDSSALPTLVQNVPEWGHAIKKVECADHACMQVLSRSTREACPGAPFIQGLRWTHSEDEEEADQNEEQGVGQEWRALELLKRDLQNVTQHCFALH